MDDITALVKGRNIEVAEMEKCDEEAARSSGEKVSSCQTLINGKEGKSKMIASCGFLEYELIVRPKIFLN